MLYSDFQKSSDWIRQHSQQWLRLDWVRVWGYARKNPTMPSESGRVGGCWGSGQGPSGPGPGWHQGPALAACQWPLPAAAAAALVQVLYRHGHRVRCCWRDGQGRLQVCYGSARAHSVGWVTDREAEPCPGLPDCAAIPLVLQVTVTSHCGSQA